MVQLVCHVVAVSMVMVRTTKDARSRVGFQESIAQYDNIITTQANKTLISSWLFIKLKDTVKPHVCTMFSAWTNQWWPIGNPLAPDNPTLAIAVIVQFSNFADSPSEFFFFKKWLVSNLATFSGNFCEFVCTSFPYGSLGRCYRHQWDPPPLASGTRGEAETCKFSHTCKIYKFRTAVGQPSSGWYFFIVYKFQKFLK